MAKGRNEAAALRRAATAREPTIRAPAPANAETQRMFARYERAKGKRDQVAATIDACYEFALPLRQRGYMTGGAPDVDRLFDGTAVTAVQGLASQTLDDVWPADQTPFELKAGPGIPEEQREDANRDLAGISAGIIDAINNSNFRSAAHECLLDYCIGTGVLLVEEGDAVRPINFRAIPLTQCVLDEGPKGEVDALFMPREVELQHIEGLWPNAKIPDELRERMAREPSAKVDVLEGMERDWSKRNREVWFHRLIWRERSDEGGLLLEEKSEGVGACPFLTPSFTRVAGEVMGRGPVMLALSDIRVLNKLTELMLEHADLQLAGIWTYDDDGVINPDTAILEPGSLIPKMPGTDGLKNVVPTGNFQVGQIQADQLRAAIKEALYVNDLGDITKTPKTATEIAQRTADRARRLAGAYGRLLTEFLFPLVSRVWWLLKRTQGMPDLPPVDGERIKVRPLSPLTRAQAQDDILRHVNFLQTIASLLGPQAPMLVADTDKLTRFLADKMGFNPTLLRTTAEQQALMQQAMQMAQQAGMVPQQGAPA